MNTWNFKHLMVGMLFSPLAYAGQHTSVSSHAGHDMSAMQQPTDTEDMGMTAMEPVITESRTPIRPITDEDRKAAFNDLQGHKVHDSGINYFILLDQLEWQRSNTDNIFSWSVNSWVGGDIDRLWIKSEGKRVSGKTESAEAQLLWGHAIGPWWDLVAGIRQDFRPSSPQTWGAIGFQGLALYNFESEITAFVGSGGKAALRLGGEYDILFTNRLILQPSYEVNFYSQNDESRGTGSGLSDTELGLRLRYEVRREFAPYIGVSWDQRYGNSSDFAKNDGEKDSEFVFLAGVRVWF
ncbi:Copper resistance protein B precursor [Serratia liquefaciens]|uniref:Copper resistance protein B n=1 Tax=Yersinia intermedia TaxID=631 RepID=A0A0T9M1G1_YERIN|nr:Copper resistance protein B precursor [Yersinia intermedia]CQH49081.1 Copper resistance protein B precursor [Yersinia enterocolitica]CQJ58868.1 Copper resistance protein B precursor [Yersinia enterocolitica]SUI41786.1 Copper resistance protein B precursor [Serratia liquefaciens]